MKRLVYTLERAIVFCGDCINSPFLKGCMDRAGVETNLLRVALVLHRRLSIGILPLLEEICCFLKKSKARRK